MSEELDIAMAGRAPDSRLVGGVATMWAIDASKLSLSCYGAASCEILS